MFTQTEYNYLLDLVESYILKGDYKYYVAYTNTNVSDYDYNRDYPDLYVVFSNDQIVQSGSTFEVTNGRLISLDSDSATRNGSNGPRMIVTNYSDSLTIPQYEFIYTNVDNSVYPDLIADKSVNLSYNPNFFMLIPFSILLIVLCLFWFRRK